MGRSKRELLATAEETLTPPDTLAEHQSITRVVKATGNNLFNVQLPTGDIILVELPSRFRSTIWIKRGGYVLVDQSAHTTRSNKLDGEIINVVREEKQWRRQSYWPSQFEKRSTSELNESDSTVGRLPTPEID